MNLKDHVNFFENKKVLVTGGTGLIGRFVVNKLCELNADVTVVSLDELKLNNKAIFIKGDLDKSALATMPTITTDKTVKFVPLSNLQYDVDVKLLKQDNEFYKFF